MIWKRRRLLILTLAVACIGAAVGTAFSVVTQTASDPQTRDEVYHEGMSLQEFAAAATGQPGEIAPPCPRRRDGRPVEGSGTCIRSLRSRPGGGCACVDS
jgi:hypothetical protein